MGAPWIQDYNRTIPSGTPPSGGLRYQLANSQTNAYVFIYSSPNSTGNITATIYSAEGQPSRPYTIIPGGLLNQGPVGVSYVDVSGSGQIVTVLIADSETAINASLISSSITIANNVNLSAQGAPGSAPPSAALFVGGTDGTDLRALATDTTGAVKLAAGSNVIGSVGLNGNDSLRADLNPTAFTTTLATGGTAQLITTTSGNVQKLIITNTSATDTIKVGTSVPNIPIAAGGTLILEVNDPTVQLYLSDWYFVGPTAGDSIAVTYM